jgi:cytochrome c oxidase subunit II
METAFSGASNLAEAVDRAFIFVFTISFIFTIGITVLMIYIVIHFSRKKGIPPKQFSGNTKLEIIWTVIPLIIVLIMFYYGTAGFSPMRDVPEDAMPVKAIGRMWAWSFDYGNGKISDQLVVPYNRNVKLDLVSVDVNHSLFIPAFRVKEDVVPGYNNYLWFRPTVKGEFDIFCAEYCGLAHSAMLAKVIVVDSLNFEQWLADLKPTGDIPDHPGLALIKKNGCLACHSLDGSKVVGPTFKGLYGTKRPVITDQGENQVDANDEYIKNSIKNPNVEVVKGYNKGLMQSYKDMITEEDLDKIVDYFKTAGEQK